jgi:hypothetical protein
VTGRAARVVDRRQRQQWRRGSGWDAWCLFEVFDLQSEGQPGCFEPVTLLLTADQHTSTLRAAVVLLPAALAQLPGGSVFRRLSQEVEAAAAERQGGIKVYQLQVCWTCAVCGWGNSSLLQHAVTSTTPCTRPHVHQHAIAYKCAP